MDRMDRRGFLECMAWIGTGVVWTAAGGTFSARLLPAAEAAESDAGDFSFVQISDTHIGFKGEANKDAAAPGASKNVRPWGQARTSDKPLWGSPFNRSSCAYRDLIAIQRHREVPLTAPQAHGHPPSLGRSPATRPWRAAVPDGSGKWRPPKAAYQTFLPLREALGVARQLAGVLPRLPAPRRHSNSR
jgi:hypothetical protein